MALEYSLILKSELEELKACNERPLATTKTSTAINIFKEPSSQQDNSGTLEKNWSEILDNIPKQFKSRAKRILSYISKHPDVVSITSEGLIAVDGNAIDGLDPSDVIMSLLSRFKRAYEPVGMNQVMSGLARIKLPLSLVSSPKYRKMLAKEIKAVRSKKNKNRKGNKKRFVRYY